MMKAETVVPALLTISANHPTNNLGAKPRVSQGWKGVVRGYQQLTTSDPQSDADQHWSSKSWSDNKNPIIFGMGRVSHPVPVTPRSNLTKSRLFSQTQMIKAWLFKVPASSTFSQPSQFVSFNLSGKTFRDMGEACDCMG